MWVDRMLGFIYLMLSFSLVFLMVKVECGCFWTMHMGLNNFEKGIDIYVYTLVEE